MILSGSAGCHGASVMMARAGLSQEVLSSDCRILTDLAGAALASGQVRILRDPTRGGVATTLNEFVEDSDLTIELDESQIPVDAPVAAACELLGLDPLYCACEGRMLAVCEPGSAKAIVPCPAPASRRRRGCLHRHGNPKPPGQGYFKDPPWRDPASWKADRPAAAKDLLIKMC